MKTQLTLLLLCTIFSGAWSLVCYAYDSSYELISTNCSSSCSRTTTTVDIYLVGGVSGLTFKTVDNDFSCGSPEKCVNTSINIGVVRIANNTQCCSTDRCNNKTLPEMPKQAVNGKKCYVCNENDCSQKLYCEGEEDRCLTATVAQGTKVMTMKGCTTRNMCNKTLLRAHGLVLTDVYCCEGNMCNAAEIFTLSFRLMFISLLSSVLFY